MRRKLLAVVVAVLLSITCVIAVSAETFDPGKTGSVSVTLTAQQDQAPIAGAELSVYYVASASMDASGNLFYAYTNAFQNSDINIADPSLAAKLDAYVAEHKVAAKKMTTDATGTATCKDLALGLYFIRQTGAVEGFAPCTPFVVTVPARNTAGFVYAVNASPKTEAARLTSISIKKVWNTDASAEAADHVTVQLLRNGTVVETAILDAQNNWQVTYTDMPESDAYSIREIAVPKGFTATYSQKGYVFTVTNTSTLIQTGQVIWPIPVLAAVGMLLLAVGITLLQKKRKTDA